jgi:hypothetical protein
MAQDEIKLTDEQKLAVAKGQRIGFYIAGLDLPNEEKEQMLGLLAEMNLEQLDVMLDALEKNYLSQTGQEADNALTQGLETAVKNFSDGMSLAQQKANRDLDALASGLK